MAGLSGIGGAGGDAVRQAVGAASSLVARNTSGGRVDLNAVARAIDAVAARSPAEAASLRQAVEAELTPVQRGEFASMRAGRVDPADLALDVTQVALDIVGIFEPTPFADLANTGISLFRGDGWGALMSAAGMIPYVGDLAKAGKLGKWAATVSKAVDAALANPAAMRALGPALQKISDAIGAIPQAALDKAPAAVRETLAGLKSQIDRVATPVAREVSAGVKTAAHRLGVPEDAIRAVADTPRGARPAVDTYMTAQQQALHLASFDDGIVRVTSRSAIDDHGTLGPPGGFVTSAREFDAIAREANGNLAVIEQRLGLNPGTLRDDNTVIALIDRADAPSLRVPTGNEGGANEKWVPGGYTSGNVIEAVMDFPKGTPFQEIKL